MRIYTKQELIEALESIRKMGWIKNARQGNVGGIGNTLEDLLEITENNLPLPNSGEWELKCQRKSTTSLTTLFHMEPSPRAMRFVPKVLLPKYGWPHQQAGSIHSEEEMSFRQTINALSPTDRGFTIVVDRNQCKIMVSFISSSVDSRHRNWLKSVKQRIGLNELSPQPYWGFDDLFHKAGTKLHNCFYIQAEVKNQEGIEYFRYTDILMLQKLSLDNFISATEKGSILVDFDARSGHNHGTKFRLRQDELPELYEEVTEIK
jgi:hypothetical protein